MRQRGENVEATLSKKIPKNLDIPVELSSTSIFSASPILNDSFC